MISSSSNSSSSINSNSSSNSNSSNRRRELDPGICWQVTTHSPMSSSIPLSCSPISLTVCWKRIAMYFARDEKLAPPVWELCPSFPPYFAPGWGFLHLVDRKAFPCHSITCSTLCPFGCSFRQILHNLQEIIGHSWFAILMSDLMLSYKCDTVEATNVYLIQHTRQ